MSKKVVIWVWLFALLMVASGVWLSQKPHEVSAALLAQDNDNNDNNDNIDDNGDDQVNCALDGAETAPIAAAKLIIEYNFTDNDIGVHGFFDDDSWARLCVYDPSQRPILAVRPQSQLRDLTMAGIFFESREPPSDQFSFEELKIRFPEGKYEVRAVAPSGRVFTGVATFTHNVPAPPTVTSPALANEASPGDVVIPATDLVVQWEAVTETIDGNPVVISGYEVIITNVNQEDPNGFSQPIFDVHIPPDQTSLTVSPEFLEPGTVYELEVLALEESGNQTITVGFFTTE